MKTRNFLLILAMMLFGITVSVNAQEPETQSGTWGGIDWTLTTDGTLIIAPTKGEPVPDKNAPTKRTYKVGQWREAVIYTSNGGASAIGDRPYELSKVKKLVIEEGVTSIGSFAAQSMTNLTGEVIIPWTVNYIGQEAFQKATMTKVTFQKVPEGKEGQELCIAQGAFKNLIIEEIALPDDRPIHLHAWILNNCHKLKHVTLPATIHSFSGSGNHIDYGWTESGKNEHMIFAYNQNMETITFGSEEVKKLFFQKDGSTGTNKRIADVGLTSCLNLQAAIDLAEEGETITLLNNVTLTSSLEIPEGKDITIDLNGYTVSQKQNKELTEDYSMIKNYGDLTIVDNSANQNGKISYTRTALGGVAKSL